MKRTKDNFVKNQKEKEFYKKLEQSSSVEDSRQRVLKYTRSLWGQ
jgi:hypothetical protein